MFLCVYLVASNAKTREKRMVDYFNPMEPPPFAFNPPANAWENHLNEIWRMNRNMDWFNRNWDIPAPNNFERESDYWNRFEPRINEPSWFPPGKPFETPWPSLPRHHWEAVDVTGIGRTFTSNDRPWWKGENVCIEKQELVNNLEVERSDKSINDTFISYEHLSECTETETSYICKISLQENNINKTIYTKYECCHGYKRRYDGESGCIEVDLKDLVQTIRTLALNRFLDLTTDINSEEEFRNSNFTVFVPHNDAFENYERQQNNNYEVTITSTDDMKYVLMSHAVKGFYKSGDLVDEQVILSANGQTGIRTNLYYMPEKIITANCARVVGINNYARNGIVHIVQKVLPQPTKTLAGIISSDPQFSILKGLFSQAGLVQTLRDPTVNFTLFAPTDSVFNKDESKIALLEKLMEGGSCAARTLKHHILPNVICTPALTTQARTVNIIENFLTLSRNENDKLYVDGVQIVARDIMATNGVLHIIDGILLPDEANTVTEALENAGMNDLISLIKKADLQTELDKMDNFTFFVPTNRALDKISLILKEELNNNKQKLREILLYHIVPHHNDECDFVDDMKLPSSIENKTIRINQYGEFSVVSGIPAHITAQCVRVIPSERRVCGGVLHLVDELLIPPKQNIMDVIEEMKEFSVLKHLLQGTGLDRKLREDRGPFTLFAPTDTAFYSFSEIPLSELTKDWNKAERFLKRHILNGMRCCAGIFHSPFRQNHARTIEGSLVTLHRAASGWIWFGRARIHHCDLTAENGVVHIIDKVLRLPKRNHFDSDSGHAFEFLL